MKKQFWHIAFGITLATSAGCVAATDPGAKEANEIFGNRANTVAEANVGEIQQPAGQGFVMRNVQPGQSSITNIPRFPGVGITSVSQLPATQNQPLSEVSPGSQLLPPGTTSLTFTVTTAQPAVVRADTSDKVYSNLSLTGVSSDGGTTHTFTLAVQEDNPYTFYIKAALKDHLDQPLRVTRKVNYRVLRDYNPPYPRIFTLWWPGVASPLSEATANRIARLAVDIHGRNAIDPAIVFEARRRNPHVKVLTQLYSTEGGGGGLYDAMSAADNDPNRPQLYRKVFVRNADGSLFKFFDGSVPAMYDLTNPAVVELLVELNAKLWQEDLLTFDGAFMDLTVRGFAGMPNDTSKIDLDGNGVADDPVKRDRAYEYGQMDFLRKLRKRMPNAVLLANSVGGYPNRFADRGDTSPLSDRNGNPYSYADYLNGVEYEDDLSYLSSGRYWASFDELMKQYTAWNKTKWFMGLMPHKLPDGTTKPKDAYKNYRAMRFGLTAALMGDGLYLYNGWGYYSWFDEYDAPLGYPNGPGAPVPGTPVWRRDFTGGIALVNTSKRQKVTVNLGGTYRALSGTQAPTVNDGKQMTQVTLPPLDGRILLR